MYVFNPIYLGNKETTFIDVEPFPGCIKKGLKGEKVDEILYYAEQNGFIEIDMNILEVRKKSLQDTYMEHCRQKKKVFVAVLVDKKKNKGIFFADAHSGEDLSLFESFVRITLENYYEGLKKSDRTKLLLPYELNPYINSYFHSLNFFVLSKQILFTFFLDQQEIFFFVLQRVLGQKNEF